jgi:hypothetical protein
MVAGMMKHIRTFGVAAAALAASVALIASVPAAAQQYELDGAPRLFSGQDNDRYRDNDRDYRGDRDWRDNDNNWRRHKPDFQTVQRACSRAGVNEAWNRNYYSAQYHDSPRIVDGRYGWEMRGKMRLHDRRGHSYVNTVCDYNRNGNARIEFLR